MDGTQLILTRLSEPARAFGRKNLSLESICEVVKELGKDELFSRLNESRLRYKELCSTFKNIRDKRIAHNDFETFVNETSESLPRISRAMVEEALKELRSFMNQVDGYFGDTEMAYEYFKPPFGADALIDILKKGFRYEDLVRDGIIDIMDLEKSKYYKA